MDGDLAYSLEHLELLVEKLKEFDVVIGCRNLDRGNFLNLTLLRKKSCKIFYFIYGKIFNLPYRDMQAGLKGFNKIQSKKYLKSQKLLAFHLMHNCFF
jgi:dolichyl-phosphate beta-glucosyltransferase